MTRVEELKSLITRYQKSYYDGEGEISDAEFDKLWDELKELDPQNEILHRVGADSGNFPKVKHIMPMGSQEKAANPEQFIAWAQKHNYDQYLVEYKLDGASLELQYQNGYLVCAVTRGDGTIGDDITANAKKMSGVNHAVYRDGKLVPFTGGIRGEVIMTHEVHKKYFPDKANCRNAANGIMKRKDGQGSEYLKLIVYDALSTDDKIFFTNEEEKIKWLMDCGFNAVKLVICRSQERVIAYRAKVMEERKTSIEYDIDGLVIKERNINLEDASRDRPDRQIAFKFSLEEAVSTLRQVEWSRSGGTYTPVAIFDEVELNGTKVQRASLSNPDTMRKLGVKIGSHVLVVKRGEIIPKIESVVEEKNIQTSDIEFPHHCETCGSSLIDEGSRLFCPNKQCPKRILHQLLKYQQVVDIRDLGETLITSLFNDKRLKCVSDIYSLTVEDLVPYFLNEESMEADKKSLGAQKVYNSIQSHRKMKLSVFVGAFDIEGVGETSAEKLVAAGFNTLSKLLNATQEEISRVYGFGEIMARIIVEGLAENSDEMKKLVSDGTIILESESEGKLLGKSFCFTGELVTMKRSDAEQLVKKEGGAIKSSVTKDLSYLVTNDTSSGSSKNIKAAKFGIPVIDEKQFLELINMSK
ncbi:NAD-dependent DNA ligase LigA [Treponema sp. Marseille-Q3903]|uniref:NAD-dependent DNA ligase LigA n=1 Tax=Treponema sp. Marseille-Q3903 TaxID=2766703 RepID=UPI0016526B5B|nr:NAD-dependent DNA ligase LigA [Treponema sp. Marseille-Q3903]MBC6713728.1 NAD-dependent DNA ligase LigA [Treponema sp. Marseille-Q3903]